MRAMSTWLKVKSMTSKFSRMYAGSVAIVFTLTPFCSAHRSAACPAVRP